jgi:hypothetical protein
MIDEEKKLLIHASPWLACPDDFLFRAISQAACASDRFLFTTICRAEPDAEAILRAARLNPLGQSISLKAQLRTASANTPFQIVVDDAVHYRFENPDQELILELRDDSSSLSERLAANGARPAGPLR